jgi:hypothetical protein
MVRGYRSGGGRVRYPYRLWEETREEEAGILVEDIDGQPEATVVRGRVPRWTGQARFAKRTGR